MSGLASDLSLVHKRRLQIMVDFENELCRHRRYVEADITGQLSQVNGTYVSILGEALTAWGSTQHVGDLDRYAQAPISVDEALIAAKSKRLKGTIDAGGIWERAMSGHDLVFYEAATVMDYVMDDIDRAASVARA